MHKEQTVILYNITCNINWRKIKELANGNTIQNMKSTENVYSVRYVCLFVCLPFYLITWSVFTFYNNKIRGPKKIKDRVSTHESRLQEMSDRLELENTRCARINKNYLSLSLSLSDIKPLKGWSVSNASMPLFTPLMCTHNHLALFYFIHFFKKRLDALRTTREEVDKRELQKGKAKRAQNHEPKQSVTTTTSSSHLSSTSRKRRYKLLLKQIDICN